MARAFSAASNQYLLASQAGVTTYPLTMACWFRVVDTDHRGYLMNLGDTDGSHYHGLVARGDLAGDPITYYCTDSGGTSVANTTAGYTAGVWYHAAIVGVSSISRWVYLSGGNANENTTARTPTGIDNISLGGRYAGSLSYPLNGAVCEAGLWGAALSSAEIAMLALGIPPYSVRPADLYGYWPELRTDQDLVGGYNLTAYNSPTWADHAAIVRYPRISRSNYLPEATIAAILGERGIMRGIGRGIGRGL